MQHCHWPLQLLNECPHNCWKGLWCRDDTCSQQRSQHETWNIHCNSEHSDYRQRSHCEEGSYQIRRVSTAWTDKTQVSLNFLLGANIKMLDSFHIIHRRIHSSELLHVTIHKQKQMIRNKSRVCRWPTHTANFTPWKCCQVKKGDISTYSACLALARRRPKQSAPQTQRKVSKL